MSGRIARARATIERMRARSALLLLIGGCDEFEIVVRTSLVAVSGTAGVAWQSSSIEASRLMVSSSISSSSLSCWSCCCCCIAGVTAQLTAAGSHCPSLAGLCCLCDVG